MIELNNQFLSLLVDEEDGMTVTSLKYMGKETIDADAGRKAAGSTYGIPILFPTPNRVSGDAFEFNGKRVRGVMHGLLRHAHFKIKARSSDMVVAEAPFALLGDTFPYEGKFILTLSLLDSSLLWKFCIENDSDESIAFGIALHPFFLKRDGMMFESTLEREMVTNSEKIPTGESFPTAFGEQKAVSAIDTDTVFFSDSAIVSTLSSADYTITIDGSDDFNHVVVYTAPDKHFICVEPQTCSTDAHNMYRKGFLKESGLIITEKKSVKELWARFRFSK